MMSAAEETTQRQAVIDLACAMGPKGLNRGRAGNVSLRWTQDGEPGFLITPTGLPYNTLQPEDIVFVALSGEVSGVRKPSSEWRLHRDIYVARPEAGAVLHAHAPFATALACLRQDIPPFHYMIARFGGSTLRCADYATFGTEALSKSMLRALEQRRACLLANHGLIVLGANADDVLALAVELEDLCEQYVHVRSVGEPVLLDEQEMATILEKFSHYGQQ